jgi:class 3 adenylate cyclase
LAPADLVRFLNVYLSAMSDIVEQHGGLLACCSSAIVASHVCSGSIATA